MTFTQAPGKDGCSHLKGVNILKPVFSVVLLLSSVTCSLCQEKTFIREYTHHAGDMDSRISSRAIALDQVRSTLLEEIGVYVESEQILKTSEVGANFRQDFVENISTISAGVTKIEVLEEKWNGYEFWIRAKITVDPDSLAQSLKQLVADKNKVNQLEELSRELELVKKDLFLLNQQLKESKGKTKEDSLTVLYNKSVGQLTASEHLYLGIDKMNNNEFKLASQYLTMSIELSPHAVTYFYRGYCRYKLGDKHGSLADFNEAIRIDPTDPEFYLRRGLTKSGLDDRVGAQADFTKGIELDPDLPGLYKYRAFVKLRQEDFRGAIADFDHAVAHNDQKDVYLWRGKCKGDLGDHAGARDDFSEEIRLNPYSSEAYYHRGKANAALEDWSSSIDDYTTAIKLEPTADAYFWRGLTKMSAGQISSGCTDLISASALGRKDALEYYGKFCR
jgi:tetratricopeptide (TPR) repeat protein